MPHLEFRLELSLVATAVLVSFGAGVLGSFVAVRRVMLLPPAEAMRPAAPPNYARTSAFGSVTLLFGTASRMVVREIVRRPMRTLFGALGIGAATGIIIIGQHFTDAMDYLVDFYLQAQQRETMSVSFLNPISSDSATFLKSLPGVRDVQWLSAIQVRARAGHHERTVTLLGRHERSSLRPLLDGHGREQRLSRGEARFTDMLAKALHVKPGDTVWVEPLLGDRTPRSLKMTGTVSELMALWIHVPADDLQRLLGTENMVTGATMLVDKEHISEVQDELLKMPQVGGATRKELLIAEFRKQQGKTMGTFSMVLTLFAITIAISVVYNNARVSLSLRARELASLRVLGFTRAEISTILVSELGIQVLIGIPFGLWFGKVLVQGMLAANDPEAFRFPATVGTHAYAVAALVTTLAAVGSALLVRRKLDKLDLIEVLKTRE